jgi:hypothetical protein
MTPKVSTDPDWLIDFFTPKVFPRTLVEIHKALIFPRVCRETLGYFSCIQAISHRPGFEYLK